MALKLYEEVKQFGVFEKDEHQMQQVNVDNYLGVTKSSAIIK